jgi:hypothetical protein
LVSILNKGGPEVTMNSFCKLFNEIDQKLKTIDVHLLQLGPQDLIFSLREFAIDKFHLFPTQTADIGQIIDIVIVPRCRMQFKWNLGQ